MKRQAPVLHDKRPPRLVPRGDPSELIARRERQVEIVLDFLEPVRATSEWEGDDDDVDDLLRWYEVRTFVGVQVWNCFAPGRPHGERVMEALRRVLTRRGEARAIPLIDVLIARRRGEYGHHSFLIQDYDIQLNPVTVKLELLISFEDEPSPSRN